MKYFQQFPKISYLTTEVIDGKTQTIQRVIPNMTVKLQLDVLNGAVSSFETYRIKDGDRVDTVAAQMYGSSMYAWVIMLANNMRDIYDWPFTDDELFRWMNKKYESSPGANDGFEVSLTLPYQYIWILDDGRELAVDETTYNSLSPMSRRLITEYDHELEDNDKKRLINLVSLSSLQEVINQFNKAVSQ